MDINLPIDETSIAVNAVYFDRKGNATPATDAAWTDSDSTVAAIDGSSGATVNLSPVSSTVGATTSLGVSGAKGLTASSTVTLAPGTPVSMEIQTLPPTT